MEQFSLDKWLENPSRKVVVEKGYEVKIISTDAPGNCPIVGYIYNGYSREIWLGPYCWTKKGISPKTHEIDLFFADEEEELTEFESKLADLLVYNHPMDIKSAESIVKRKSKTLLDLARKELQPEFASVEENDCTTCINDKGCVTCENGELHESINKAEEKALEAYPKKYDDILDSNVDRRIGYHQGYDQAIEDFMEKAERWLEPTFKSIAGYNCGGDLINDFKNYMQDESENL